MTQRGKSRFLRRKKGGEGAAAYPQPILKSPAEIEGLRKAGHLVAECFAALEDAITPGVSLSDLDAMVEAMIVERGAAPLYKGYQGSPPSHPPFPGVICASINEEICHGLPDGRVLSEGDIIAIDIGLRYEGWCGDACVTYPVGTISDEATRLVETTHECLQRGIQAARAGRRLRDIGAAIEKHATRHGYSVVTAWGGHGIGRDLHEPPSVPHTSGQPGDDLVLKEGLVFTIEPMINVGSPDCVLLDDGWTVVTEDGELSAQFEHTIAITSMGPMVLSV